MPQPAFATGQPLRDLPQRLGLRELAEDHRHKLIPTTKALAPVFGLGASDRGIEFLSVNQTYDLAKQAGAFWLSTGRTGGGSRFFFINRKLLLPAGAAPF